MGKLDGRVALITGAGRGIGAAVAETMAAEGASVVVNDLGASMDGSGTDPESPAQQVVAGIEAAGGKAIADGTDVTDFAATEALIARTVEQFGRLDVLVNCAGIIRDGMIFKMEESQWDSVISVHLKGTFNTTRHASAWWRQNRGGQFRLINFVSGSGIYGSPVQPNYAAAKMGIVGLTYSCANSLAGYGVTSNCIAPVAFTRMTESLQGKSTVMDYSPDNPRISAANVVPPVVWLATEECDWINGRILQCGNGRIGLFSNPSVLREVVTDGVWDLDTAFAEMDSSFREALLHPNPFARPRG
ncbi:MAG: SDR family NAD(P)-dependent oxidoreductase [Myxococcota bacterium]|nr:SDR family NAD(P)-dependent oxidoreductase [Myxococcota bacterium]